jgi:hypothetical protein
LQQSLSNSCGKRKNRQYPSPGFKSNPIMAICSRISSICTRNYVFYSNF